MKTIKDIEKALPGKKARMFKLKHSLMAKGPENTKNYLKQSEKTRETATKTVNKERRRFLDMVGKAGISSPILKSSSLVGGLMANRYALAQNQDYTNTRVVYVYLNSGAQNHTWLPDSPSNMNIVTQPYGPQGYDVAGICNFRQVNVMAEGHSNATQALGIPGYGIPTMDTRIAGVLGATSPFGGIYLGSQATTQGVLCSTIGPCEDNPATAFQKLFQTAPPPVAGVTPDTTYLKVFEAQQNALASIKNKLSQDERERLDTHGGALEKIENRIKASLEVSDEPTQSACVEPGINHEDNIQSRGKAQADIIVAALQCGLTKVATLQLGNHQGDWYGHNTAYKGDAHNSCHSSGPETNDEMVRYLSDVPAYLLQRLMQENGPDGKKLIETTVFVQVTCMGNGRDHSRENGPFIVASQLPGFNNSFSSFSAGTTEDLNGAIPKGMGIPSNLYEGLGGDDLGLLS